MTKHGRHPIPMRWIADDHGDLTLYRQCSECRSWKPADTEHFYRDREDRLVGQCKPCRRANDNANRVAKLAHAESSDAYKARAEESRRRWRERNPEHWAEIQRRNHRRRYRRKRAEVLELQRIDARLRAERRGRPVVERRSRAVNGYRGATGGGDRRLDPRPLREWLEAVIADEQHAEGFEVTALCRTLGCHDRQLRQIRNGEYRTVGLHVADRLLTGYGRPVVIRSRDLERRLVQWAQGLPGNGTRLLAYLDRAEAVAHIADVAVLRVDDLYPALDEEG